MVLVKKFGFRGKHKIQDRWENHVYEVLESYHSSPLVFRIRREDGTGNVRVLYSNLLVPLRTRILDEELPVPHEELEDCNQSGILEDPIQEDQEDSSEEEQDPDNISEHGDDQSVPTRSWTRSQGPPPVLVGTQSLSKCSLNTPPSLLPEQGGAYINQTQEVYW